MKFVELIEYAVFFNVFFTFSIGVFGFLPNKGTRGDCGLEASTNLVHHNPWLVFLEYHRRGHLTEIRCGGTLIDKRHIITAAHCVNKPKFRRYRLVARLGEYDTTMKIDCVQNVCADPLVRIEVADIVPHPDYDGMGHDIAILRLAHDAPYTDFIRPICLPTGTLDQAITFAASGWGEIPSRHQYSTTKKIIPLPKWNLQDCQKIYSTMDIPDKVICAGGEEGIDTCRGDSGGPLTWIKDRTELWGVTSLGNVRCGMKGYPAIYTSVIDYLDWIETVVMFADLGG